MTEINNENGPWDQMEGEPDEAYTWFSRYYLPLGLRRSLRSAYRLYVMEEQPQKFLTSCLQSAPSPWSLAANMFVWNERALAYDKIIMAESFHAIEEAAVRLRNSAPDAVDALIRELKSSRNAVAAAKEILDRAGVQTAAIVRNANLSADDYAKAEEELTKWMDDKTKSSG